MEDSTVQQTEQPSTSKGLGIVRRTYKATTAQNAAFNALKDPLVFTVVPSSQLQKRPVQENIVSPSSTPPKKRSVQVEDTNAEVLRKLNTIIENQIRMEARIAHIEQILGESVS